MVSADVADLTEPELRQEILKLRQRVEKLAALVRFALTLLQTSGFSFSGARLPDGVAKLRILDRRPAKRHESARQNSAESGEIEVSQWGRRLAFALERSQVKITHALPHS